MKGKRRVTRDQQLVALAREFLKSKLSAAGVSYVVTSRTKFRRHIWSIVLLITAGCMAYMTYKVVSEYLKYPKTVVKEDTIHPWLYFPGVTICPLNPISASNLDKTGLARMDKLKKLLLQSKIASVKRQVRDECYGNPMCRWSWFREQCGCVASPCSSEFCVDETEKNCSCSLNMCQATDETLSGACNIVKVKGNDQCWCDMNFKYSKAGPGGNASENVREVLKSLKDEDLKEIISLINDAETPDLKDIEEDLMPSLADIYNYGTEFDRLVVSCSFEGKRCDKEDFTLFFHPKYGKCYMFNYAGDRATDGHNIIKTRNYGSSSGLFLILQTQIADAVELLRREMGVRVALHNSKEFPFISEHGFNIRIGDVTAVEVTLSMTERLGEPWGSCMSDGSKLQFTYEDSPYNQLGCQKRCRHYYTLKACNCTKRSFLLGKIVQGSFDSKLKFCKLSNKTQARCVRGVLKDIELNKINCNCVAACWQKQYTTSLSTGLLNKQFFRTVKGVRTLRLEDNGISHSDNVSSSDMVGLKVYYKTLQVEIYEEVPSYSWETLVANIGGNLGFFMGLSLVTFMEVCEFLWDVLLSTFSWNRSRINKAGPLNRNDDDTLRSKPEHNLFSEALNLLRREHATSPPHGRTTDHYEVPTANRGTSMHPVDVYTLPRERRYSRRLYTARSSVTGRRNLFKRRQIVSQRHDSISSSTPYSG